MIRRVAKAVCLTLACLGCTGIFLHSIYAQSVGQWDDRFHSPRLEGVTHAVAADPEHVYVAGRVDLIGAVGIARWDGNSWHALGSGLDGDVHVMAIGPDGMLYVGGEIQRAGDATGANIVKWNGSMWEAVANYSDQITRIAVGDNGVACVGYLEIRETGHGSGARQSVHGDSINCFGQNAPPKIPEMTGVYSMVFGSGDTLYAVGNKGSRPDLIFAVWNGSEWSTEDLGVSVRTLGFNDETLYGIGDNVMVNGLDGWVEEALIPDDSRGIYAGDPLRQPFYVAGEIADRPVIFKLEHDEWSVVADSLRGWRIQSLALDDEGNLYVAGDFEHESRPHIAHFARWDGQSWDTPATGGYGLVSMVRALARGPDGCIYAGGEFTMAGPTPVKGFACWDGQQWLPVRDADGPVPQFVTSMTSSADGSIYVIGRSTEDENDSSVRIFQGMVSGWSAIPEPMSVELPHGGFHASVVTSDSSGTLYAAGRSVDPEESAIFGIAKWNGQQWHALGTGGERNRDGIQDMTIAPDGRLIVAGAFQHLDGVEASGLAAWDGSGWSSFGAGATGGMAQVNAVAFIGDTLYIGGSFSAVDGVPARFMAYFDGAEWHELNGGLTGAAEVLLATRHGDLVVGGRFGSAGGSVSRNVALWSDGTWTSMDDGLSGQLEGSTIAIALAEAPDNSIFVGGHFLKSGDVNSYNIARWIRSEHAPSEGPPERRKPFPNPAVNGISVPAPDGPRATILIYDVLGRERSRIEFDDIQQGAEYVSVPLGRLTSGVYAVSVRAAHQTSTYSIVVVR